MDEQELEIIFVGIGDKETVKNFVMKLEEIALDESISFIEFRKKINTFLNSRKKIENVDDAVLTAMGEKLIRNGQYDRGIFLLQNALKRANHGDYSDGITLFLRLAEYEFNNGSEEKGIEYLTNVCEKECSNYVEAIGFRNLTDIWLKYKHYVEGNVRESVELMAPIGQNLEECSKQIEEILEDENTLLEELSIHLNEMSANGECLNKLNNWEKKIYYIDELWSEVNSGGFDSYLYYNGVHFEKAYNASEEMDMIKLHSLMEKVKDTFPKSKIPKSLDKIEDIIDDNDLEFEEFDTEFYGGIESEISNCLKAYIMKNKRRLR